MTDKEKEELEFAHKTAEECIHKMLELKAEKRKLYKQIVELEERLEKDVAKAQHDKAKEIFNEMYRIVSESEDYTIIVTADDVKRIAKRYGVRVNDE